MEENILKVKNLTKNYPGVQALKGVNLEIKKGIVHCIVGENGAGKSTFIKIITGVEKKSSGEILFNNIIYNPRNTREAMNHGISAIFQELNIIEQLNVEQNLILGREDRKFGIIRKSSNSMKAFRILNKLESSILLHESVSKLSTAKRQIIEIAKAISVDAKIIIMDEPTAALSETETQRLFEIIRDLKKQGITIIYISHRLEEIFKIADYVTVFRDGEIIETKSINNIESKLELIKMMVGKVIIDKYQKNQIDFSTKVLEVENLHTKRLRNINFDLYKGEILGFYGLIGSGKTEIARALYGLDQILSGNIKISGMRPKIKLPRDSIKTGMSLVPEERRLEGLIINLSIRENISVMNFKKISRFGVVKSKKEKDIVSRYIKRMEIGTKGMEQTIATLSGGNQQKVVISKCLNAESKILMMDEPTRGVDVGVKEEIHKIIRDLSSKGVSIIIFSSELTEILNNCDRILLLYEGEIKKSLKNEDANPEEIMHIVTGA